MKRLGVALGLVAFLLWGWGVASRADPPGAAVTTVPSGAPGQALAFTQSPSLEYNHVFKTSAGNLYAFGATSTASAGYMMLLDASTVPGTGSITSCGTTSSSACVKWCAPIQSGSSNATYLGFQLSPGPPMPFKNGVIAYLSSQSCTYVSPSSAGVFFEGQVY